MAAVWLPCGYRVAVVWLPCGCESSLLSVALEPQVERVIASIDARLMQLDGDLQPAAAASRCYDEDQDYDLEEQNACSKSARDSNLVWLKCN